MTTSPQIIEPAQLVTLARANIDRSRQLIARAKACIRLVSLAAVRMNRPPRRFQTRWAPCSVTPQAKNRLLAIAPIIKDWFAMPKDEIDATLAEATPAEAAAYMVELHVPRDLHASILRALPKLTPYSFHHAAWQIRRAAFNRQPER